VKQLPFRQRDGQIALQLLDEEDAPWISALVDELEAAVGRPWRELLERIERLPVRAVAARRAAVIEALRKSLSGREEGALKAAVVRRHLLGRSAVDPNTRAERVQQAATSFGVDVGALEAALWTDLPGERLVVMRDARPSPMALAAAANLAIIQSALMRCHSVRLRMTGNARAIVRTAVIRGLIATARRRSDHIEVELSGPLSLFHRTTVYGRALGSIVPHLAWCESFTLDARCDFGRGQGTLRLQPPVLLPPSSPPQRFDSKLEARFVKDMAKLAPHWRVLREPTPIDAGAQLAFPDFMLQHRELPDLQWWLEIVGYWRSEYLAAKLATYRAARLPNVVLCIDANRAVDDADLPRDARIVRFEKHVPIDRVLALIEATTPTVHEPPREPSDVAGTIPCPK
jgi:predicted nuclease of restriction endonuclease-like RecB superfamily